MPGHLQTWNLRRKRGKWEDFRALEPHRKIMSLKQLSWTRHLSHSFIIQSQDFKARYKLHFKLKRRLNNS